MRRSKLVKPAELLVAVRCSHKKMKTMQITSSVIIERPLADVESYLTDISNDRVWQEDVIESAVTTSGPIGKGTAGYEVRSVMGFPVRTEWKITSYRPGTSCTFASTDSVIPYEGTIEFADEDGATRVTYRFTMSPEGIAALFDPLIGWGFEPRFRRNLEHLKELLERS